MKKLISLAAASTIALTVAATALAKEATAPGQQCKGLSGMAHQRCMRSTVMNKKEDKVDKKVMQMKRMYNKRQLKEVERDRQRTGEMNAKTKNIITNSYYNSKSSVSSSSSSSKSSSSAASSTSSASSASSASSTSSQ